MIKNAIILAAGKGSRMGKLTENLPKCLIEINGDTILEKMLENLLEAHIKHCTIVIGYLGNFIKKKIGWNYHDMRINYIENNQYEETNDMYSLWLAREIVKKGTFLIEGDIYMKSGVITEVVKNAKNKSFYLVGKYRDDRHNILLSTAEDGRINTIIDSNDVHPSKRNRYYISTGILLIQPDFGKKLINWLDSFVNEGKVNVYYDSVISNHINETSIFTYYISGENWVEIDTEEDLNLAKKMFSPT